MGQLDRLRTELPESAEPIVPKRWGELNTITIAFGHGLSVAPLQAVMGVAALMNGGILIPPTFLKRTEAEAQALGKRVIKPETSEMMRYLMRLNVEKGTAEKAEVPGYYIGGKTGTADKVVNGRYSKTKVLTDFMAVLPADQPRYLLLIMLDEPQAIAGNARLHHLGLERGADRRHGGRAHRAAARHRAAHGPADGRSADTGLDEGKQVRRSAVSRRPPSRNVRPSMFGTGPLSARQATGMKLADLPADADIARALEVGGVTADSRAVKRGDVFVAIAGGKTDGLRFVDAALAAGAVAVVAERPPRRAVARRRRVRAGRQCAARAGARWPPSSIRASRRRSPPSPAPAARRRSRPSRGRSGRRSAISAASIGTIGIVSPRGETYGSLTTPDPVALHRSLDALAGDGVTHLAIEASSHGLDQHRLDGLRIAAGGFTNITRDHLDYHPSFEAYLAAKLRLFEALLEPGGAAVIDVDHEHADAVVAARNGARLAIDDASDARAAGIRLVESAIDGFSQRCAVEHRRQELSGAPAAGRRVSDRERAGRRRTRHRDRRRSGGGVRGARASAPAPRAGSSWSGRAAARRSSSTTRTSPMRSPRRSRRCGPMSAGRLVVVFGAGGDRDRGKRPLMGAVAADKADRVIVTDDNPRSEDAAAIRAAILAAAPGAIEIGDRARGDPRGDRRAARGRRAADRRQGP